MEQGSVAAFSFSRMDHRGFNLSYFNFCTNQNRVDVPYTTNELIGDLLYNVNAKKKLIP